jgi:cGMP-dependent protein kinase
MSALANDQDAALREVVADASGARLGILTKEGTEAALQKLGISVDITHKLNVARNVHIFRYLSEDQVSRLVAAFESYKLVKGAKVIKEGEVASQFFVISKGEVAVLIGGQRKRTQGRFSYFGERALLFDEPRTASVEVISDEAELWSIDKATFLSIVKGKMHQSLLERINLQDTDMTLKDVAHVKVIGTGAAGTVRLVQHKKTKMRYALKSVRKERGGAIPDEVRHECELLAQNDHPFVITLVKTFETANSVDMLMELRTGGELHAAIREIPTVLTRAQCQFYAGCLVIIIEELGNRKIVYRDLKPENVMLDNQGYLKLIDFGIAKKLADGGKTYTVVGTPHYMAPEIMLGHGYGTEVDLWTLGVMIFEFVCGYLPFADAHDDPNEVCQAVLRDPLNFPPRYKDRPGKSLMTGLMTRQAKNRTGCGINGYDKLKKTEYFTAGYEEGASLFDKILGRELDPPLVPKGEVYVDSDEVDQAEQEANWSEDEMPTTLGGGR